MWEAIFTWASVGAGVVAAALWFVSTRVRHAKMRDDIQDHERNIWLTTETPGLLEQPFRTSRLQSRWNAWAAGFTAIAVLLQALSLMAHQLSL